MNRDVMNLANLDQVREIIRRLRPNFIVNPAAYTAVDKAESELELAMRINGLAPPVMPQEAAKLGAALVHYRPSWLPAYPA